MSGVPNIPLPKNEPVLGYAPGSTERASLKARINAIARTGIPEVNAMTEGFLDRG